MQNFEVHWHLLLTGQKVKKDKYIFINITQSGANLPLIVLCRWKRRLEEEGYHKRCNVSAVLCHLIDAECIHQHCNIIWRMQRGENCEPGPDILRLLKVQTI